MITATFLALAVAAAPADAPPARVLLKSAAAGARACRTKPVDGKLVEAALFSPDSARCPVAKVGDDVIELGELASALEGEHLSRPPRAMSAAKRPGMDFTPALDRVIATRLVVQEAREMRLDEDPQYRGALADYKAGRLRSMLQAEAVRGVKPDPAEVERLYREAVREWNLKSILLEKEADAKAFEAALKAGAGFDALAKKFVADRKAKGGATEWASKKHVLPELVDTLEKARIGNVIGPVKVPSGWAAMRIEAIRYPSGDKMARQQARASSQARREHEATRRFYLALVAKHAKVDQKLLDAIDFEAKGVKGFEALAQDPRPIATLPGEKPVTVADLTREVSMKFFHGIESPIQQHQVNRTKTEAFEKLLGARVFAKEAADRKLDRDPAFVRELGAYERSVAFAVFLDKVIAPDVVVTEQDAIKDFEAHKSEYTTPQMYKLDGFAFANVKDAQAALDKLKSGTDFTWLRNAAPNQLPPEKRTLQLEGATLSVNALPPSLVKTLTGVRQGESRLFSAKDGEVWVIRVLESIAPQTQPYAEAREKIAKRLFDEKLIAGMRDYADKLRKAQKVDVLITKVTL